MVLTSVRGKNRVAEGALGTKAQVLRTCGSGFFKVPLHCRKTKRGAVYRFAGMGKKLTGEKNERRSQYRVEGEKRRTVRLAERVTRIQNRRVSPSEYLEKKKNLGGKYDYQKRATK